MITITRKEKIVDVNLVMSIGWSINLEYARSSEMDAVLLNNQLNKDLRDFMETVRREAYDEGWKDKTKRNRKRTYFPSSPIKKATW